MKNRVIQAVCVIAAVMLALVGCSRGGGEYAGSQIAAQEAAAPAAAAPRAADTAMAPEGGYNTAGMGSQSSVDVGALPQSDQKIIRNAELSMETKTFDQTVETIEGQVKAAGGYIENSYLYGKKPVEWNDSGRNMEITARIPSANLDAFLSDAKSSADVINERLSAENISDHYYDIVARKESYQLQLNTLEQLLQKAESLNDVIALEQEIARVRYEIESMESSLRRYDNQVSYSTVSIHLAELTTLSRPMATEETFSSRLSSAFIKSLKNAQAFAEQLVIGLVYILPTLLIILVIALAAAFIVVRIVRLAGRKSRNKGEPIVLPAKKADSKGQKPDDKN